MADEKEPKPKEQKAKEPKKPKEAKSKEAAPKGADQKTEEKGLLETAAVTIGSTLGAIAAKTGLAHPEPKVSQKIPKLAKKNKSRLPRKEKKKARKASGGGSKAK